MKTEQLWGYEPVSVPPELLIRLNLLYQDLSGISRRHLVNLAESIKGFAGGFVPWTLNDRGEKRSWSLALRFVSYEGSFVAVLFPWKNNRRPPQGFFAQRGSIEVYSDGILSPWELKDLLEAVRRKLFVALQRQLK